MEEDMQKCLEFYQKKWKGMTADDLLKRTMMASQQIRTIIETAGLPAIILLGILEGQKQEIYIETTAEGLHQALGALIEDFDRRYIKKEPAPDLQNDPLRFNP